MSPSGYKQNIDESYPIILLLVTIFSFVFFLSLLIRERKRGNKSLIETCFGILSTYPEITAILLSTLSVATIRGLVGHSINFKSYVMISFTSLLFWYYVMLIKCSFFDKKRKNKNRGS